MSVHNTDNNNIESNYVRISSMYYYYTTEVHRNLYYVHKIINNKSMLILIPFVMRMQQIRNTYNRLRNKYNKSKSNSDKCDRDKNIKK